MYVVYFKKLKMLMKLSIFSVNCIVRFMSDVQKISDKWEKVHFALEVNQEQHID